MLNLEAVKEKRFDSFDEVLAFTSEEKRSIVRLPIGKLWDGGARIHADGRIGTADTSYKFNPYGFQSLCNLVGVSDQTLHRLKSQSSHPTS